MGIELPDPSKPKSKFNNRKMTFDKICRDLLLEICENHVLYMQREVSSGGREYLEKQQYILQARAEGLAKAEAALEAALDAAAEASETAVAGGAKCESRVTGSDHHKCCHSCCNKTLFKHCFFLHF